MPFYELGMLTTGTGSGAAAVEIVAVGREMHVLEIGIFLNAATASIFRVGRPGNTPAGGTVQVAANGNPDGVVSGGGIILSGWSTAPTVPTAGNTMRMMSLPGAIGNGIVWNWNPGELIVDTTRSQGLVLWNEQVNSACRVYLKFME